MDGFVRNGEDVDMKVMQRTLCLGMAGLSWSCQGEEARLREEAARLVELYQQVQYEAPPEVRAEKLSAIERAVFVSPDVVAARDVCLAGHKQLLDAQRSQEQSSVEIEKALAKQPGEGAPLPADTLERLQQTLVSAQQSLGAARTQLEDCEGRIRALNLRFGKRS
jgi:hypothetical protein